MCMRVYINLVNSSIATYYLYSVLEWFKVSCLADIQVDTFSKSWLRFSTITLIADAASEPEASEQVSSSNRMHRC